MTYLSGQRDSVQRASGSASARLEPVLLALFATLFVTLIGLSGSDTEGIPNSDDLLRLVEVRDLLAGQSWFDLTQYRLGLDGGTVMH